MPSEFRLPALGADMDEGTVLEWHVAPGARVKRGDVVAVVETDKGAIDVEIFMDGVVREIVVPPGTKVPVGTVLALVDAPGETTAAASPAPSPPSAVEGGDGGRLRISPAARRRARELDLEFTAIKGTGPDGATEVRRAIASTEPPSLGVFKTDPAMAEEFRAALR